MITVIDRQLVANFKPHFLSVDLVSCVEMAHPPPARSHACPLPDCFPLQLAVTTLESRFRMYDMRTQHPTEGFSHLSEKAHKSTVWLARHLPQNRDLFMTGGGNGGFNLYKYHYPISRVKKDKVRKVS